MDSITSLFNSFFKPEHFKIVLSRIFFIKMLVIEKLNNVKSTAIDIEMNIPFFKVRCECFSQLIVLFSCVFS